MARTLLAFAGLGSAVALGYRGDWAEAVAVAAAALLPAVWWVRGELAAAKAVLREPAEPAPEPLPRGVRLPGHPPWETAPVPVLPSVPGRGIAAGRHRKDRSVRDAVGAALRAAAQVPLP